MTGPLIDALVKALILLACAWIATRLLRRRSAALRHLVWLAALTGVLVLPLVSVGGVRWDLPVLPAAPSAQQVNPPAPPADRSSIGMPSDATGRKPALAVQTSRRPAAFSESVTPVHRTAPFPWASLFIVLWATGAAVIVGRYLLARMAVRRMTRHAAPASGAIASAVERARARLGVRSLVPAVLSSRVSIPAVAGLFRPVLLLPAEAEEWAARELEAVALHELAHVRRRDAAAQLVATISCAVWWFLPPVWYAAHRAELERERACDDVVLHAGTLASEYADCLLALLRMAGAEPHAAMLAMGSPSRLAERIGAILDPKTTHGRMNGMVSATLFSASAALFLGLGALHPAARPDVTIASPEAPRARPSTFQPQRPAAPAAPALADTNRFCWASDNTSSQSMHNSENGHRSWRVSADGPNCSVDLRADGKIEFNDDFTDVAGISDGGWFRLSVENGNDRRELEIRPGAGGKLERTWKVNGTERPWDAAAQAWFADFLIALDRRTAVGIDQRFPRIYAKGGVPAVMAETGLLTGDYARDQYYTRLLGKAKLNDPQLRELLDQATALQSDYYRGRLLQGVASQSLSDPAVRKAYLTLVTGIGSDYTKEQSLDALMQKGKLSSDETALVLDAGGQIGSDYNRSQVLQRLIQGGTLTDAEKARVAELAGAMESDYQVAQVLSALANSGPLTGAERQAFLKAVGGIQSDHSAMEVLQTLLKTGAPSPADANLILQAVGRMNSDYQEMQVLTMLTNEQSLQSAQLLGVVEAARRIGSDYDKGQVLRGVLAHPAADDNVRKAVFDAADGMGDYERGRVRGTGR